jgi:glycosyltransferase involved in cell wall biosynthesis
VVTSNVSSLPEVVGDAAITVDPRDVEALARAVHAVMSEEGLRRGLIRRGLERVKAFSWSAAAEQTAAVYRQVAATAPRRRIRGG